jgi:3-oxoacyl-[acyl-carrier protein] reductase
MNNQNQSRTALVTGAAGGLGRAICARLLADGYFVFASDLEPQRGSELSKAYASDDHFAYLAANLELEADIASITESVSARRGKCDVLVNNAGLHVFHPDGTKDDTVSTQLRDWNRELAVNLTAPFLLCRAVLPAMIDQRWGRIINITSRSGRTGVPFATGGYSASKGGLAAFSRLLASEIGQHGVTSNCIAPGGLIRTPLSDQLTTQSKEWLVSSVPLAREGLPEEIASAVAFLASDDAAYLTGTEIDVNGGLYMA